MVKKRISRDVTCKRQARRFHSGWTECWTAALQGTHFFGDALDHCTLCGPRQAPELVGEAGAGRPDWIPFWRKHFWLKMSSGSYGTANRASAFHTRFTPVSWRTPPGCGFIPLSLVWAIYGQSLYRDVVSLSPAPSQRARFLGVRLIPETRSLDVLDREMVGTHELPILATTSYTPLPLECDAGDMGRLAGETYRII